MAGPAEFWDLLSADETADLAGRGRVRQWLRGDALFREAAASESVLVLRSGRVKVCSYTAAGAEVVLAVRVPGALLGELSAIDRNPRSATVIALEPVTALVVPVSAFESFLRAHGRVAFLLMRLLTGRLRDADRKRVEFGAHDTATRVAVRLVELVDRFGEPTADGVRIALPLSQDELAGWTGASREAVSKALGALRAEGLIRTSRLSVVVRDLNRLRARAG